jgi:hypothetical protein
MSSFDSIMMRARESTPHWVPAADRSEFRARPLNGCPSAAGGETGLDGSAKLVEPLQVYNLGIVGPLTDQTGLPVQVLIRPTPFSTARKMLNRLPSSGCSEFVRSTRRDGREGDVAMSAERPRLDLVPVVAMPPPAGVA